MYYSWDKEENNFLCSVIRWKLRLGKPRLTWKLDIGRLGGLNKWFKLETIGTAHLGKERWQILFWVGIGNSKAIFNRLVAQIVKNLFAMWETSVWSLGWEDHLEKGMATHSSTVIWRTPCTEEPGGLQSIGSQRLRRKWATNN